MSQKSHSVIFLRRVEEPFKVFKNHFEFITAPFFMRLEGNSGYIRHRC